MLEDNLGWYHLALCRGMDTELFNDDYESDPVLAANMDSVCLSCSVRKYCLKEGIENHEYGLWGGVFLVNGKIDKTKNAHKTEEVWEEIQSS